jgi:hypothetical protein
MFLPRLTITKETTSSTTTDPDLSCRKICWAECSNSKGTLAKAMIKWEELACTIHQFGQLGRGAMHSKFKLGSFGRPDSWCCETSRVTTIWQCVVKVYAKHNSSSLKIQGQTPVAHWIQATEAQYLDLKKTSNPLFSLYQFNNPQLVNALYFVCSFPHNVFTVFRTHRCHDLNLSPAFGFFLKMQLQSTQTQTKNTNRHELNYKVSQASISLLYIVEGQILRVTTKESAKY